MLCRTMLAATAVLTGLVCGCSDSGAPSTGADGGGLGAAPSAAPASGAATRYLVDPFGTGVFLVAAAPDGGATEIKGIARTFSGTLHVDPHDLRRSRGTILVDLSRLETHTFGDEALDARVTAEVRHALGIGSADGGGFRFARFTVRSIDEVSERDIAVPSASVRTVLLKVTGELELHGVAREKKAELEASVTYAAGRIARITVKTSKPIGVTLSAHRIQRADANPRDKAPRPSTAPGDDATLSMELTATPDTTPSAP